jgi:hypothetical protein
MLAGEGLHPSSRGARVRFDGESRTVIQGPFAGPKDLVFAVSHSGESRDILDCLKLARENGAGVIDTAAAEGVGEFRVPLARFEFDQGGEIEGVHQRDLGKI